MIVLWLEEEYFHLSNLDDKDLANLMEAALQKNYRFFVLVMQNVKCISANLIKI